MQVLECHTDSPQMAAHHVGGWHCGTGSPARGFLSSGKMEGDIVRTNHVTKSDFPGSVLPNVTCFISSPRHRIIQEGCSPWGKRSATSRWLLEYCYDGFII